MAGGTISLAEWQKIIAEHGEPITRKVGSDKKTTQSGDVVDDPYPTVDYTFADGASISMKGNPSAASGPDSVSWSVTAQKGILSDTSSTTKAPTTRNIGGHVQQWDPTTQQWVDPPGVDNTSSTAPKNTVPGTGTTATPGTLDHNGDPSGATAGTPDLPVDVYTAQNNAKNDETARKIAQQNADTARLTALQQQARDAWQQGQAQIEDGYKNREYNLDVAKQMASELHQRISEDLERSAQALTARGQDITARGQDLNYLGNQSYVTKGQYESLQGAEGQLAQTGGVAFTPSPTPPGLGYDPAQLAASLAQQALGQTQQVQQPFSLGQAPAAPAGPGFVAPSFEQGGIQTNNPGTPPLALAARR